MVIINTVAAYADYGSTLCTELTPGTTREIAVQAVWSLFLRLNSIAYSAPPRVAVWLSLESYLVEARLQGYDGTILLHVDNTAAIYIVNNMMSANPALISELRNLQTVLTSMKVTLKAIWFPPAMNKHAERLRRT